VPHGKCDLIVVSGIPDAAGFHRGGIGIVWRYMWYYEGAHGAKHYLIMSLRNALRDTGWEGAEDVVDLR
jgi:hypothetical protein